MNSESLSTLADRIRQCAEMAGSGDELARKTAIPRRTLESYLAGESEPKASRLVVIADAAGVSVEWLVSGRGPKVRDADGLSADATTNDKTLTLLRYCLEATQELSVELGLGLSDDKVTMLAATLFMAELEERTKGRPPLKPAQVVQLIKRHVA